MSLSGCRQVGPRVRPLAVDTHLEVEVGASGAAGAAGQGDDIAGGHRLAYPHQQLGVVGVEGGQATNTSVGPTVDGQYVQTLSEGYEPYMFYVYKQLYDANTGKPIEGAYADLNNDGMFII